MSDKREMPILLTETRTDDLGKMRVVWLCEPPAIGVRFQVLEQEWNEDFSERRISRILVASDEADDRSDAAKYHDRIIYGGCEQCGETRRSMVRIQDAIVILALNCPSCGDVDSRIILDYASRIAD